MCDIEKCRAECCGIVPVPTAIYELFIDRISNECNVVSDKLNTLVFNPKTMACGFLNEENKCSIYDYRPSVCRRFGDPEESHPLLKCRFLGQCTEEEQRKSVDKAIDKIGSITHG